MFCKECGAYIPDGATYCSNCGVASTVNVSNCQPTRDSDYNCANTTPTYHTDQNSIVASESKSLLVKGILALAFACTFWVSFLGIVFGAMTNGLTKSFISKGNALTGKAKVGSILGKAGLITGIVMTALFVFYLITLVIAAVASTSYLYY